jgi:ATP-dependent exoDNAse (exonuclease V) beta subunit
MLPEDKERTLELDWSKGSVESLDIDFSRPHGKRFGSLVHAILSVVPLDSDLPRIQEVARLQGRILGAKVEEIDSAIETVRRALEHPLLRRAAGAAATGQCRREVPLAMQLESGVMVEGIVDLAFKGHDENSWTLVDYKTDFEMEGRLEEYLGQVSLYGLAISRATGEPAKAILLRI